MNYRLPIAAPVIGDEELQNVVSAVKSGWISSKGPFIEEFEKGFSSYVGTKYGVATSNGTTALHLALSALGIGKGDEVLIPSLTFIAVANAVTYTGAKPVFVDSNPDYWCLNPSQIQEKISERTKAIIVVHIYGHPCNMNAIANIAKEHSLFVVEDCAEAHGAEYRGEKVGSFGIISCFSFYANKIITTGEGGMCLTKDIELSEKMRILRDHGMNPRIKYWHDVVGYNYRMTNLQGAIGVAQLKRLDQLISKKRYIAAEYAKLLEDVSDVFLVKDQAWAKNVYWLYSVLVKSELRDKIINSLDREGVETRPFFYPIHVLPPYKEGAVFPIAEKLSSMGINLPSGPELSVDQIQEVVESLGKAIDRLNL